MLRVSALCPKHGSWYCRLISTGGRCAVFTSLLHSNRTCNVAAMPAAEADISSISVAATAQSPLLTFEALPAWLQDNAYILRGYRRYTIFCLMLLVLAIARTFSKRETYLDLIRRPQYSWSGCARSIFGCRLTCLTYCVSYLPLNF